MQGGGCDHIIQDRGDHVFFFYGNQSACHDFGVVKHIVDLVREPFARQFNGIHFRADILREIPAQRHLADSDHHIDRRSQLMGYIRKKHGVLLLRRLKFCEKAAVPLMLRIPAIDPMCRKHYASKGHKRTESQAEDVAVSHIIGDRAQHNGMV